MQAKLRDIKDNSQLDCIIVTDEKGFVISSTSGIKNAHHVHALKQLGNYFFPETQPEEIVVAVETTEHTTILQSSKDGKVAATREKKSSQEGQ